MMAAGSQFSSPANPQPKLADFGTRARVIGALCLAVSLLGLVWPGPQPGTEHTFFNVAPFFRCYLSGYLLWLGVSLGCLAIVQLHHLVGGNWGMLIRRLAEASIAQIPLLAILFIPVLIGMPWLFPWTNSAFVKADPILQNKALYLNYPFFIIRAIIYFSIWMILAGNLRRWSLAQDHSKSTEEAEELAGKMGAMSAPGLLLFFLTVTFVSVDWIMSREPHWYSTVQGMMVAVGMTP